MLSFNYCVVVVEKRTNQLLKTSHLIKNFTKLNNLSHFWRLNYYQLLKLFAFWLGEIKQKFKMNFFSKNSNCMYLTKLQCQFVNDAPIFQYTENGFRFVSIELWMCAMAHKRTTFTFCTLFYYRTLFSNIVEHEETFFRKNKKSSSAFAVKIHASVVDNATHKCHKKLTQRAILCSEFFM